MVSSWSAHGRLMVASLEAWGRWWWRIWGQRGGAIFAGSEKNLPPGGLMVAHGTFRTKYGFHRLKHTSKQRYSSHQGFSDFRMKHCFVFSGVGGRLPCEASCKNRSGKKVRLMVAHGTFVVWLVDEGRLGARDNSRTYCRRLPLHIIFPVGHRSCQRSG